MMKKIIHIILGKANPNRMNGVNKVVYQLASAQVGIGEIVEVWGITKTPNDPSNYSKKYRLRLFQKQRNPFRLDPLLVKLIEYQDENTIFHFHGGFLPEMYAISQLLVKLKKAYLFTPHGSCNLVALQKNYFFKKVYFYLFERRLIQDAKYVHLIGRSELEAMEKIAPYSRRVLIPNGQDLEQLEKLQYTSEINFGFMGRFTIHTKGLDLLLKGFKLYREKHQGTGKLQLVGSGGEITKLKKLVDKMELNEFVFFPGAMFGYEKKKFIRKLTAFFHPSRNEGLPGAVLEASALGVPCVVSRETNLSEYINEYRAGFGLSDNSPVQIAYAMKKLEGRKNAGSLHYLGNNARKMIAEEFDWEFIARRFSNELLLH
ncbi:MAG: hypothetical protein COC06_04570 [Bacteroidales bacterium]|nr:MAG: hypothetical protein COC06_04570 [Bacteroidales bacterium]